MRPPSISAAYGSCVQPPPGGTTSPCALSATVGPAPKRQRTTRLVTETSPAAAASSSGTAWRSTSKPSAVRSVAARRASGALSPGGLSLGRRAFGELGRLELAQELGMRANERELLVGRGIAHGALQGRVQ